MAARFPGCGGATVGVARSWLVMSVAQQLSGGGGGRMEVGAKPARPSGLVGPRAEWVECHVGRLLGQSLGPIEDLGRELKWLAWETRPKW
jgi:hypothetical protein